MRYVIVEDKNGYKHKMMIKDSDPDSMAKKGIPCDPPDLEQMDWDAVKRDIHNLLVERGLSTWKDINVLHGNIRSVIQDVLYRRLIALFRQRQ